MGGIAALLFQLNPAKSATKAIPWQLAGFYGFALGFKQCRFMPFFVFSSFHFQTFGSLFPSTGIALGFLPCVVFACVLRFFCRTTLLLSGISFCSLFHHFFCFQMLTFSPFLLFSEILFWLHQTAFQHLPAGFLCWFFSRLFPPCKLP